MNVLDSIIGFLKTFKSPSVNFFVTLLLLVFAPSDWKFVAIFPAGIFLGWLWDYCFKSYLFYRGDNKRNQIIEQLQNEELLVLNKLRQEKMLTFSLKKAVEDKDYLLLRELERKLIVECSINHGYGGKFYHFSLAPLMRETVQKFFSKQKQIKGKEA